MLDFRCRTLVLLQAVDGKISVSTEPHKTHQDVDVLHAQAQSDCSSLTAAEGALPVRNTRVCEAAQLSTQLVTAQDKHQMSEAAQGRDAQAAASVSAAQDVAAHNEASMLVKARGTLHSELELQSKQAEQECGALSAQLRATQAELAEARHQAANALQETPHDADVHLDEAQRDADAARAQLAEKDAQLKEARAACAEATARVGEAQVCVTVRRCCITSCCAVGVMSEL